MQSKNAPPPKVSQLNTSQKSKLAQFKNFVGSTKDDLCIKYLHRAGW